MNAIKYLVIRNIIGILRNMIKKKSRIVLIIFLLFIFTLMLFSNNAMDDAIQIIPNEYISTLFAAAVIVIAAIIINQGLNKGSSSYRMADVHFVFPSPISPKLILIYGFLKQFAISIAIVLWFVFQSVNFRNLFGLSVDGFSIVLLAIFIVALYMPISSMMLYSITLRKKNAKKILSNIYLSIGVALGLIIISLSIYKGDPIWALKSTIGSMYFEYIPIVGWVVALLNAAKYGFTVWSWTALALLILGLCFIFWRLLSSEIPFYEEVLKKTDEKEKMLIARKSGATNINTSSRKTRIAKVKYKGFGASALFYRQILEYKKAGFLFFDKVTFIMLFVGIAGGLVLKNLNGSIQMALYTSIYLNFLFSFTGKWVTELNNTFIYLLPDSSLKKLWYATAANHIKHLVDGMAVFIPVAIILSHSFIATIGYILAYAGIGAIYVYADVLSRRLFGKTVIGNATVKVICIMLILTPAIVGLIIVTSIFSQIMLIEILAPFGIFVYCAIISLVIMLIGKRLFEDIELI